MHDHILVMSEDGYESKDCADLGLNSLVADGYGGEKKVGVCLRKMVNTLTACGYQPCDNPPWTSSVQQSTIPT